MVLGLQKASVLSPSVDYFVPCSLFLSLLLLSLLALSQFVSLHPNHLLCLTNLNGLGK